MQKFTLVSSALVWMTTKLIMILTAINLSFTPVAIYIEILLIV